MPAFRRGTEPVRFLLRPGLEIGYDKGVLQTMFWSTPKSKIVPLALYMGYRPIYGIDARGKEIVFLLNRNFVPLLKVTQCLQAAKIEKVLAFVSRIAGRRKARG